MSGIKRLLAIAAAATLGFSGCATTNQIGFPPSTSNHGKLVSTSLTHFNILFLVPASGLESLVTGLSEQCGNGKVEGITMVDTRRYFYIFGVLHTVEATGRCAE